MRLIFNTLILATIFSSILATNYLDVERPSTRTYSLANEICCNGTIYENKNSNDYECCGGKLIEKKTSICCYPEAYPRQPNIKCCDDKTYNSSTHTCFLATHTRERQFHHRTGKSVIMPIGVDELSTCGDKVMDLKNEICCHYEIFADANHDLECCWSTREPYNPDTHVCCGRYNEHNIIPKSNPNDTDCCGAKSFNPATEFCNKDMTVHKTEENYSMCNDTVFDTTKEICCEDVLSYYTVSKQDESHESCCGNISYNSNNFVCCSMSAASGEISSKLHSKIDAEGKDCCGTELVESQKNCCHDQKIYDSKTQTCCSTWLPFSNKVYTKITEGSNGTCCGLEVLDVEKQDCCGSTVIPKSPEGQSGCCMHTVNEIDNEPFESVDDIRFYSHENTEY